MFIIAGIAAMVFFGGWAPAQIGVEGFDTVMQYIPGIVWFMGKAFFIVWLMMWIKWTFPRLRIDQILKLEWKYLMPLALINLVIMTVVVALGLYIK
jgi:NADH-quinone oxidoreductase subunit H